MRRGVGSLRSKHCQLRHCAKTLATRAKGLVEMLYWMSIGKIMAVV